MKEESSAKLKYSLLQLQNLIKRDPPSYYEEFSQQYEHYKSLIELFKLSPQDHNENVEDLVMFLAQVSSCYKEVLQNFPSELIAILKEYATVLDRTMRLGFCKSLMLMRNRGMMEALDLIKLFFELQRCQDKILRSTLQIHIIADIKNQNLKHSNVKLNVALQNFMFTMLNDNNASAAKASMDIMIELYKRHIWRDAKTVNIIASACFSKVNKILVTAHKFFLGVDEDAEDKEESSESEDETPKINVRDVMNQTKCNKKTRKRQRVLKRTKQVLKKSKRKKKDTYAFSALHLIHDPQGMAEQLLAKLHSMNERYEIKMLLMDLVSRLVGVHELLLLNLYPFFIRYLKPRQTDVTRILQFAAQASHELIPPDVIEAVVRAIADNFITERNSDEVITVGLNATREICVRCPYAIQQDLLQDLVQYKKYRNKNVAMAAQSLIQLYRKINPQMLQRKFRSRPTEASKEEVVIEFGAPKAKSYIPGSEVLPVEESEQVDGGVEEDYDSDGSWIDVIHSDDDLDDEETCENVSEKTNKSSQKKGNKAQTKTNDQNASSSDQEASASNEGASKSDDQETPTNCDDREKAATVSHSRILSQEEFHKVKIAQLQKQVQYSKGRKRKAMEEAVETTPRSELVSLRDIERLHKKPKSDKETRLATMMEGREDREKYKTKKPKKENASKTHKETKRKKNFQMIKHKLQAQRNKKSFHEKVISLQKALLKIKRGK